MTKINWKKVKNDFSKKFNHINDPAKDFLKLIIELQSYSEEDKMKIVNELITEYKWGDLREETIKQRFECTFDKLKYNQQK